MLTRPKGVKISFHGNVRDVAEIHHVDEDASGIVCMMTNMTLDDYPKNFSNDDDEDRYYLSVCKEATSFLLILPYVR